MMIEDVLRDEALRLREFPVTGHRTYLAHAAVAPLPSRVVKAVRHCARQISIRGRYVLTLEQRAEETRGLAARLLDATPDEIAFSPSTSAGLSQVAAGLDWQRGDSVVAAEGDFPSNIYPWLNLQGRGVRVKLIPKKPDGSVGLGDIEEQVDEQTRLVSLSTVHFVTGTAIDVDAIGRFLHDRGILFCVDAIQSLGALPLSVRNVDFLAADGHKWLLGPQGFGLLYVRRERLGQMHPVLVGWRSAPSMKEFTRIQQEFPDSARRYEPGSLNTLGLVGLNAALSLILEVGVAATARRLAALRTTLVEGLEQNDYEVLAASSNPPTGITSFKRGGEDMESTYRRLVKSGIDVSLRDDLTGGRCIRVSPHFYNTDEDIARLLSHS